MRNLALIALALSLTACAVAPYQDSQPSTSGAGTQSPAGQNPAAPEIPASIRRTDQAPAAQLLENVCHLFASYPHWRPAMAASSARWGTPVHVMMAIIYQESKFNGEARPPNKNPFSKKKYASTAYGYSQALNGTWRHYQTSTGAYQHKRNYFADAANFIGWYTHNTHKATGVKQSSAYGLYLAYHEGWGGYKRRTYRLKPWLMSVAKKVQTRANKYAAQMRNCPLDSPPGALASNEAFFSNSGTSTQAFFSEGSGSRPSPTRENSFFSETSAAVAREKVWF